MSYASKGMSWGETKLRRGGTGTGSVAEPGKGGDGCDP